MSPNEIQLCHAKKRNSRRKKNILGQFLAKTGQIWEKIGETAQFELILQKNEDFFQKSESVQLLSNTVPGFNWKEKKIDDRAQTTLKKI